MLVDARSWLMGEECIGANVTVPSVFTDLLKCLVDAVDHGRRGTDLLRCAAERAFGHSFFLVGASIFVRYGAFLSFCDSTSLRLRHFLCCGFTRQKRDRSHPCIETQGSGSREHLKLDSTISRARPSTSTSSELPADRHCTSRAKNLHTLKLSRGGVGRNPQKGYAHRAVVPRSCLRFVNRVCFARRPSCYQLRTLPIR